MKTRTVQIELSPGSTRITECGGCGGMCLITADILALTNTGVRTIATYRHCEQCSQQTPSQ